MRLAGSLQLTSCPTSSGPGCSGIGQTSQAQPPHLRHASSWCSASCVVRPALLLSCSSLFLLLQVTFCAYLHGTQIACWGPALQHGRRFGQLWPAHMPPAAYLSRQRLLATWQLWRHAPAQHASWSWTQRPCGEYHCPGRVVTSKPDINLSLATVIQDRANARILGPAHDCVLTLVAGLCRQVPAAERHRPLHALHEQLVQQAQHAERASLLGQARAAVVAGSTESVRMGQEQSPAEDADGSFLAQGAPCAPSWLREPRAKAECSLLAPAGCKGILLSKQLSLCRLKGS